MVHHTKTLGDLGVLKAQVDLFEQGYESDPKEFRKSVCLRVKAPKNNQKQGINLADDYCQVP